MVDVLSILSRLNISYSYGDIKNKELRILCPFHFDKNVGSFSINIDTWKYNCFSCGVGAIGPIKFVSDYLYISYKEAKKWLQDESLYNEYSDYTSNLKKRNIQQEIKEKAEEDNLYFYPKELREIKADKYYYLISHNINQIFIDQFDISFCFNGYYKDYIIIPLYKEKKLFSFECRKLLEYEKLCEFYEEDPCNNMRHFKKLKDEFKNEGYSKRKDNFLLKKGKPIYMDNKEKYFLIYYLLKPKTLYPKGAKIKNIIFNIDNLDYDKDLYLVEGLTSISNVWFNKSENVSCLFGVQFSQEQLNILDRFKKRVIFLPDNDEAGFSMIAKIMSKINEPYVIQLNICVERSTKKELDKDPIKAQKWCYITSRKIANGEKVF